MDARRVLRAHGLPGAVGSAALAIGSLSLGWLPPMFNIGHIPIVNLLHSTVAGEALGRVAVLIGGALLLQSWLLLGTDILGRHGLPLPGLKRVLALWLLPTLFVPPLFSRDPYSYYVQGKLLAEGLNPYSNGAAALPEWFAAGVDPMWAETPTPYGPVALLLQRGVVGVAGTPYWSAVAFRLTALIGIALMARYLPRLAERHGIDPSAALWLAAMNPLVLLHFSLGGHNDALMVGSMLAAFDFASRRRAVSATLLLALAIAIKPIAIIAAPFIALLLVPAARTLMQRLGLYAASGIVALAPVAVLGAAMGVGVGWVHALTTPGSVRTWLSPATAFGMAVGLVGDAVGQPSLDDHAVAASRALCMLAAVVICLWLLMRPEGRSPVRGAMLAFAAVIGLGPVVQPWYLLWALPLAAAAGLQRPWHLKAVVAGTAAFVVYALAEPTATSDSHLDLVDSLGMLMAAAAVAVVVLASPRERELMVGDAFAHGLTPPDDGARARAATMHVH